MEMQKTQKMQKYSCINCEFITHNKTDYDKHLKTIKHFKLSNPDKKTQKTQKYSCINCEFITHNKSNYATHIKTNKHFKLSNPDKIEIKEPIIYKCLNCDKTYQYASGLSKHKNNCKSSTEIIVKNENISDKELINKLLDTIKEQSATMKEQSATMKEMIPKLGNTTNNNISLITYLNTECKDAMNLTDFINGIQHSLQEALLTIDKGLVVGLSNVFIDNLNQLPKIQRPIWCSDLKRKKNIIKDNNKWIEDKENKKFKLALTNIQQKQGTEFNKSYLKPIETYNEREKDKWIKGMKTLTDDIPDKTIDIITPAIQYKVPNMIDN